MEHRSGKLGRYAADPQRNSPEKYRKKTSENRKYEGKRTAACSNGQLVAASRTCTFNCSAGELLISLILVARSFSEMFTTYSHALCSFLASGLETRNRFQNRQEKNEFYFSSRTKNFLTKK
ncbi:MAG: hypothetical protein DME99_00480 [Verrucomicrobia bacterium]|nr:MAG: hypothetical protein DME99_00480 [Verrucomicrobiota bacterium]